MNPQSTEYSATITPLLMYYCAMALMLSIIVFFQYACFNYVALSITRRLRRSYFRSMLHQSNEFFQLQENQFAANTFCSDLQTLSIVIIDTLPGIVIAIVQLATAGVISYLLTWRLSWLISAIAVGCGIWVAILQKLVQLETIREAKLMSQVSQPIESEEKYQKLLKQQMNSGIRKGLLQGTLTGSLQFFPFLGWGAAALYGNWLLDRDLMNLPAYIYVCVSTLIPACVRIGQLPQLLVPLIVLPKIGKAMNSVKSEIRKSPIKDNDITISKKDILINFLKTEMGILPEGGIFGFTSESAVKNLRKFIFDTNKAGTTLRFSFIFAVPQVTQAISYAMGSYMVINKILTPVSVYKIVQTIYNAIGGVAIIAQYPHDIHASRLAAQKIDDNLELENIMIDKNNTHISAPLTDI
uniref:ABC transmembrane type-1 domain-containing protein n=1 Tax=Panagrolaimus sp. ES5 TaxID=591445 RepID=A0AC34F9J0_9BILA